MRGASAPGAHHHAVGALQRALPLLGRNLFDALLGQALWHKHQVGEHILGGNSGGK